VLLDQRRGESLGQTLSEPAVVYVLVRVDCEGFPVYGSDEMPWDQGAESQLFAAGRPERVVGKEAGSCRLGREGMPLVQEACAERLRLIDAYGELAAQLGRVVQALRPALGDIRDTIVIDRAWRRCDEAWRGLEQHVSEHRCGPLIERLDQVKP
jgi:hypothetical protein